MSILPHLEILTKTRMCTIEITINDIKMNLNSLNPTKACGPYNITVRMLLLCGESIIPPLQHILHNILCTGVYPDTWKEAKVTPVHKKDNKQIVNNYHPSPYPFALRFLKKILLKYLYNHLISGSLITNKQSGFWTGDSTTNELIDLVN